MTYTREMLARVVVGVVVLIADGGVLAVALRTQTWPIVAILLGSMVFILWILYESLTFLWAFCDRPLTTTHPAKSED